MKKLIFITAQFPYGSGETFIENEIKYLSNAFDDIYMYSVKVNASLNMSARTVPDNVKVFMSDYKEVSKASCLKSLFKPHVIKEIVSNCIKRPIIKKIYYCCFFDREVQNCSIGLTVFLDLCKLSASDDVVIYSYWLSSIGMIAIRTNDILLRMGITAKLVTRTHGFDLYKERSYLNYLPFQKVMLEKADRVFPCSIQGEKYLCEQYSNFSSKIHHAYLGVEDYFNGFFPRKENGILNIFSCSNVISLKRVDLIVKALLRITSFEINWTHFGDGELLKTIKEEAIELPDNIHYSFIGAVPNFEIFKYYYEHNINLFINVSSSEGLSVSIMEACSFGIPIIATDVGGTKEIVIDGYNGYLLSADFEVIDLVNLIEKIHSMDDSLYKLFCSHAREKYLESFSAEKNYKDFCNCIINYHKGYSTC